MATKRYISRIDKFNQKYAGRPKYKYLKLIQ